MLQRASSRSHLGLILARRQDQKQAYGTPQAGTDEAARLLTIQILGEDLAGPALLAFRYAVESGGPWSAGLAAAGATPGQIALQHALERDAFAHYLGAPPFRITIGPEWWMMLDVEDSNPETARSQVMQHARLSLGLSSLEAQQAGNRVWQTLRYGLGAGGPAAAAPGAMAMIPARLHQPGWTPAPGGFVSSSALPSSVLFGPSGPTTTAPTSTPTAPPLPPLPPYLPGYYDLPPPPAGWSFPQTPPTAFGALLTTSVRWPPRSYMLPSSTGLRPHF